MGSNWAQEHNMRTRTDQKWFKKHLMFNICIFWQVLPPLVDVISEARLNLVIYYLRQDDVSEAYALIKDLEPTVPQEYILKGVVNAAVGEYIDQEKNIW